MKLITPNSSTINNSDDCVTCAYIRMTLLQMMHMKYILVILLTTLMIIYINGSFGYNIAGKILLLDLILKERKCIRVEPRLLRKLPELSTMGAIRAKIYEQHAKVLTIDSLNAIKLNKLKSSPI